MKGPWSAVTCWQDMKITLMIFPPFFISRTMNRFGCCERSFLLRNIVNGSVSEAIYINISAWKIVYLTSSSRVLISTSSPGCCFTILSRNSEMFWKERQGNWGVCELWCPVSFPTLLPSYSLSGCCSVHFRVNLCSLLLRGPWNVKHAEWGKCIDYLELLEMPSCCSFYIFFLDLLTLFPLI